MVTQIISYPSTLNLETKSCAWLTHLLCRPFFLLMYIVILILLNKLFASKISLENNVGINPFLKRNIEENQKLGLDMQGIPSLSFLRFY